MGVSIVPIVESVAILLMEALGGDVVWWSVHYSVGRVEGSFSGI